MKRINQRHNTGVTAELFAAYKLSEQGFTVLFPQTTQSRYDLVAEQQGEFVRFQVKKATWSKAGNHSYLQCRLNPKDKSSKYSPGDFDFYFITDFKKSWAIPYDEVSEMTSLCLGSTREGYVSRSAYDTEQWAF